MNQFNASERARLDQIIAKHFSVSVAHAKEFILQGNVRVAGRRAKKGDVVEVGQLIETQGAPTKTTRAPVTPQSEMALMIVYEDDDMIAIDKPAGVPTHPLEDNELGTLANALVARAPMCAMSSDDPREAGIAHRLDIETSGILLAAKNKEMFRLLREMFASHKVTKTYLAAVAGKLNGPLEICEKIAHDPKNQKKAVVMPEGRLAQKYHAQEALTDVEVLSVIPAKAGIQRVIPTNDQDATKDDPDRGPKEESNFTLIKATTIFGRMHQVRVHLAHIGHPLLGDVLYGGPAQTLFSRGFFLHAYELKFLHPVSQKELTLQTKMPPEISLFSR